MTEKMATKRHTAQETAPRTRNTKPISAGAAIDKIRRLRTSAELRAREAASAAYRASLEKSRVRESTIAGRVSEGDSGAFGAMLAALDRQPAAAPPAGDELPDWMNEPAPPIGPGERIEGK